MVPMSWRLRCRQNSCVYCNSRCYPNEESTISTKKENRENSDGIVHMINGVISLVFGASYRREITRPRSRHQKDEFHTFKEKRRHDMEYWNQVKKRHSSRMLHIQWQTQLSFEYFERQMSMYTRSTQMQSQPIDCVIIALPNKHLDHPSPKITSTRRHPRLQPRVWSWQYLYKAISQAQILYSLRVRTIQITLSALRDSSTALVIILLEHANSTLR